VPRADEPAVPTYTSTFLGRAPADRPRLTERPHTPTPSELAGDARFDRRPPVLETITPPSRAESPTGLLRVGRRAQHKPLNPAAGNLGNRALAIPKN